MEAVLALVAVAVLGLGIGRLLRRRSSPVDEVGGFLAGGLPVVLSDEERQAELEEGALDPDELDDEPLVWDEGADDEVDGYWRERIRTRAGAPTLETRPRVVGLR